MSRAAGLSFSLMMSLLAFLSLPLDTARLWLLSLTPAQGAGFLSLNPAVLAASGPARLYAGAGWQENFVPGPAGGWFRVPNLGTLGIEAGASFAYSRDTAHIIRDDTSAVDTITQRTRMSFYTLRLAFSQERSVLTYGFEALGALGQLSDDFSSASGTIFPDDIVVSSSPVAYAGGVGIALDMGLVSFGAHGRYWFGFLRGNRGFRGDSLNSFVLRETLIPDSLTGAFPPEIGLELGSRPLGLSGELLYRGQPGGLLAYERGFGANPGLTLRLACGWMGEPLFLGDATASLGRLGFSLRGGYWAGLRAGGLVIYTP